MALNIYFKNYRELKDTIKHSQLIEGLPIIWDVEEAFEPIKLEGSCIERQLIKEIEHGEYLDNSHFKDRFGRVIKLTRLSTGCKAALVILHNPDKFINTVECNIYALGSIITYCKSGNIPLYTDENKIPYMNDKDAKHISVLLDGIYFTDFDKLNYYIAEH